MKITELQQIIKEEIEDLQKEGFMDWFKKKKEEPAAPESEPEPEGPSEEELAAEKAEMATLKEDTLKMVEDLTRYLYETYDFIMDKGGCRERTENCKDLYSDYPYHFFNSLVLKDSDAKNQYDIKKILVSNYSTWLDNATEKGMKEVTDIYDEVKRLTEKAAQQADSTYSAQSAAREKVRQAQASRGDEYEWRGGDLRKVRSQRTPGGGHGLTRENKLTRKQLEQIIKEETYIVLKGDPARTRHGN